MTLNLKIGDDSVIKLIENEKISFVIENLYHVEFHYTIGIFIRSGDFCGKSSFCISVNELNRINNELQFMYNNLSGSTIISDQESDALIEILMGKNGHLFIKGQIGGSFQDHFMRFKFESDQTILYSLMEYIRSLLK